MFALQELTGLVDGMLKEVFPVAESQRSIIGSSNFRKFFYTNSLNLVSVTSKNKN